MDGKGKDKLYKKWKNSGWMANANVKAKYERMWKSFSECKCKCQGYTKNTVHSLFDVKVLV